MNIAPMTILSRSKAYNSIMVADIHTHILHVIDDGSSSVDESLELLKREKRQGVCRVALTPHFDLEQISVEDFLKLRQERYDELVKAIHNEPELMDLKIHLGAEVRYNPNLINVEVEKLAITNTNYILLELPIIQPFNLEETLEHLISLNIVPIFAHVERYSYLNSKSKLLRYKKQGVIMQCNTSALLGKTKRRFILRMIKKGYVDILASDSHNTKKRFPRWDDALKSLGIKQQERIKNNTLMLFANMKEEQNI